MKKIIIIIFVTLLYSQKLVTDLTEYDLFLHEMNSVKTASIHQSLYIMPYIQDKPDQIKYINLLSNLNLDHSLRFEPVLAIRASNSGFEMYQDEVPSKCTWISPGIKINSTIPLMTNLNSLWLYSWSTFYKHSAYGFNNVEIQRGSNLFPYSPKYSTSFYVGTVSPEKGGIDFDQSEGGISLLSDNLKIIFGKFRTSLGPSMRSNLSISNTAPPFEQIFLQYNNKKFVFTYLIGSLDSNIPLANTIDDLYTDQWEIELIESETSRLAEHSRYVANHRIDYNFSESFRIGLYEQLVFGARNIPAVYLIPVLPYWSSQHEQGDLDNVMMGFDIDFIRNNNRYYLGLFVDEWAPYSTFKEDNRNWFAYQFGYSRYFNILNNEFLLKAEYTKVDPRAYSHRFAINELKHHGYNLGYWSGRNSDDLVLNISTIIDDNSFLRIMYEYTRFPIDDYHESLENQYSNQAVSFLEDGFNFRQKTSIFFTIPISFNINCDLEYSYLRSRGLYNVEKFDDFKINLRYNISK